MCCELSVICLVASRNEYRILCETWSCELLRCLAGDRKSTPKFHCTMFSLQISWLLGLFWRWEMKICFLRNYVFHCIFIRLHGNIFSNLNTHNLSHKLSKQTTRKLSISFVIHDYRLTIIATNDSKNWLSLYADWLRIINLLLLTFGKRTQ